MTYIALYQRPDFVQCREHGPDWEPYTPEGWKNGGLHFRNKATGATVSCPAIWYNQTVETDCEWLKFCIQHNEERAAHWQKSTDSFRDYHLREIARTKAELKDLITRSIAAGRPLRNGGGISAPVKL